MLDFNTHQLAQFDKLATKIEASPEHYLQFDSVSDFYKVSWLDAFPKGTTWRCTGLDNGADQFDAVIQFKNRQLRISVGTILSAKMECITLL